MEDSGGREGGVPESDGHETRIAARSSLIDSIKGCGISGMRIDKDELRADILMPEYLRKAMAEAIKNKAVSDDLEERFSHDGITASPKAPIVVFINSRSGGRHGPELKTRLEELMAEEQVFDLSIVRPREFFQYGLACLEKIAHSGDTCARQTREKLRVLVAGGDGTVGWVLGCIAELYSQNRTPVPPTGIIPLGTGNDLSRSFGWGGSFPYIWKSAVKRSLTKVANGPTCNLDSWHVVVTMPSEEIVKLPENMRKRETCNFDQDEEVGEDCPKNSAQAEGTFYNYFSIGMDAQVAYGFHHLRDEKPYLAKGPIANKLIYSGYGCTQGWFCTPCINDPGLRGLNNVLELHVKRLNHDKWEQIEIPPSVRAIVALNLHNYGSGRHPWGDLKPEYLEKREFVEAHADDGLLEIFGLKQGWHATMVMVELIKAKHLAQATAIKLKLRGDLIKQTFLQMDGEPWKQPLRDDSSTFVEIRRERYQSLMIRGD